MPRWYLSFHGDEGQQAWNNLHSFDLDGNQLGKVLDAATLPGNLHLRELRGFVFDADGDLFVTNAWQGGSHVLRFSRRPNDRDRHDFVDAYVADLGNVIDFDVIRDSKVRIGVDPLGGAGVHYWARIAEHYRLDLTVVSDLVDPTFGFMSVDWDGKIRMDPSSPYAMQRLQGMKDRFDIAFACDTDHDRHGIVTPTFGLMPPNHYLTVAIDYLFRNRNSWSEHAGIGKTVVSTSLIDRVSTRLGRKLFD